VSFSVIDLVSGLRTARAYFLAHLIGLRDDQWDWKPYPACKSIRETLAHMVLDDRAALYSIQHGHEPNYAAMEVAERDLDKLLFMLRQSHEELCAYLLAHFSDQSLDSCFGVYGSVRKLGQGIPDLASEDYFHAGQVTFIRLATDPAWDYYAAIYGIVINKDFPE
jgi:hypothetical protein